MGKEISSGLTAGLMTLPVCLSLGFLAFAPLGADFVGLGAAAGLYTAAFARAVIALADHDSPIASNPSSSAALIMSGLAGSLLAAPVLAGRPTAAVALMAFAVALTGIWQLLGGALGLGRLFKLTPYPVLAGFINGVAVLIALKQVQIALDISTAGHLVDLLAGRRPLPVGMVLLGALVAGLVLRPPRALQRVPAPFVGLAVGMAVYHIAPAIAPIRLGPTLGHIPVAFPPAPPDIGAAAVALVSEPARLGGAVLLASAMAATLATLESLLTFRLMENLSGVAHAPGRGLLAQGVGNLSAALVGGVPASAVPATTLVNFRAGGRTRISVLVSAGFVLAVGTVAGPLLAAVPVIVLAALLAALALRLFDPWIITQLRRAVRGDVPGSVRQALQSLAVVVAVMLPTTLGAVGTGAIVGIVLSGIIFIASMARPVVRRRLTGEVCFSRRLRPRSDQDHLQSSGGRIVLLELQGVVFFGNADDLSREIRNLGSAVDCVLLDFRRVMDIDASGIAILRSVAERFRSEGRVLALCAIPERLRYMFDDIRPGAQAAGPRFFPDQDTAVEWDEERRLAALPDHAGELLAVPVERLEVAQDLTAADLASLIGYLKEEHHAPGAIVCREGDPGDRMWILTRGTVSVRMTLPAGQGSARIASRAAGTVFGEMALLEGERRSATVIADTDIACLALTTAAFADLRARHPRIAATLLLNLARILASRLRITSTELQERVAD